MRHRHLSLMHGGRCPCPRCRFEARATLVLVLIAGALLATGAFWLNLQWVHWVLGR